MISSFSSLSVVTTLSFWQLVCSHSTRPVSWVEPVFFFFKELYCPIGNPPMGNSDCFPRGKPAATEPLYPTYGACWVF